MKVVKSILSTFVIIVLVIAIAAVIIPKTMGIQMRAVLTASMSPEIPVGSMVVIVPTDFSDINVGDDITFIRDKNLTVVTHRIIEKNEDEQRFVTQGIANNTPDAPVSYENVIGVVKYHMPVTGYIFMWLDTLYGKIITITAVLAIWIVSMILGRTKKISESEEYEELSWYDS